MLAYGLEGTKTSPKKFHEGKKSIAATQMGEAWPFYCSWVGSQRAPTITPSPGTGLSGVYPAPRLPSPSISWVYRF